jgi:hypothetical protein
LGSDTGELLVAVTENNILFSSLDPLPHTIMRHFPVPGIPKRILYSKYLNQLVVGIEDIVGTGDTINRENDRVPYLYFSTATPSDSDASPSPKIQKVAIGEPGERIKSLVEYSPSDGVKHYEMLAIALEAESIDPNGMGIPRGRLVCLSTKHILKGNHAAAKARLVMSFRETKLTALCPIGMSGLLIGAGNEIILHSLNVETRKWETLSRHALPSLAASIDVQGSCIFIACIKHSLLILHENNGKLKFYASDSAANITNNVVVFDRYKAFTTSVTDRGTTLDGFAEDRFSNSYKKIFSAKVPLILDRLRPERPWQTSTKATHREAFIGSTMDGTLYRFMTLNAAEWRLLQFIQDLWFRKKEIPPPLPPVGKPLPVEPPRGAPPSPAQMHINGDNLARMLERGPSALRELVGGGIKIEDDLETIDNTEDEIVRLRELAAAVLAVDTVGDVVNEVVRWLRKILEWPTQTNEL